MSSERSDGFAGDNIPEFDGFIRTARNQPLPTDKTYALDWGYMPFEGCDFFGFLSRGDIPQFDGLVSLADASRCPSGLKLTPFTSSVCPLRVVTALDSGPGVTSQSLIVLSVLPDANRFPSGLKLILWT